MIMIRTKKTKKEIARDNWNRKSTRKPRNFVEDVTRFKPEGDFPKFVFSDPTKASAAISSRRVVDINEVSELDPSPAKRAMSANEIRKQMLKAAPVRMTSSVQDSPEYSGTLFGNQLKQLGERKGETGSTIPMLEADKIEELADQKMKSFWRLKKGESLDKITSETAATSSPGAEYFSTFFSDRERRADADPNRLKPLSEDYKKTFGGRELLRTKKRKVSPRTFWFMRDYTPPRLDQVPQLKSQRLKFVMMNEARAVRLGAKVDPAMWEALEARAAELSPKVKVRSSLRFLQPIASVYRPPSANIARLLDSIWFGEKDLKAKHHVFLMQAMSRMRVRDPRLLRSLRHMSLLWPTLPTEYLLRAGNAVAVLDLCSEPLVQPLRAALLARLEVLTRKQVQRLKLVTILNLLGDDRKELVRVTDLFADRYETGMRGMVKPWEVVDFELRTARPDLYAQLKPETKDTLERLKRHRRSVVSVLTGKSFNGRTPLDKYDEGLHDDEDDEVEFEDSEGDEDLDDLLRDEELLSNTRPGWARGGLGYMQETQEEIREASRLRVGSMGGGVGGVAARDVVKDAMATFEPSVQVTKGVHVDRALVTGANETAGFARVGSQASPEVPGVELARFRAQTQGRGGDETLTHEFASDDARAAELEGKGEGTGDALIVDEEDKNKIQEFDGDALLDALKRRDMSSATPEQRRAAYLMRMKDRAEEMHVRMREKRQSEPWCPPPLIEADGSTREYTCREAAEMDATLRRMGVRTLASVAGGPYRLDLVLPDVKVPGPGGVQQVVVEVNVPGQFYANSNGRLTATAQLRHKHINMLGCFRLVHVPSGAWDRTRVLAGEGGEDALFEVRRELLLDVVPGLREHLGRTSSAF